MMAMMLGRMLTRKFTLLLRPLNSLLALLLRAFTSLVSLLPVLLGLLVTPLAVRPMVVRTAMTILIDIISGATRELPLNTPPSGLTESYRAHSHHQNH